MLFLSRRYGVNDGGFVINIYYYAVKHVEIMEVLKNKKAEKYIPKLKKTENGDTEIQQLKNHRIYLIN